MKWVTVLPLLCLVEFIQVESGPQNRQSSLNTKSFDTIKSLLKCASTKQQKIMNNCLSLRANKKSDSMQSVATCILRRNKVVTKKTQPVDFTKLKEAFIEESTLSTQQKKAVTADLDVCIASHPTNKSSSSTAILKTYLCTVDSMIVNGCADEKAKLTNSKARSTSSSSSSSWTVYRGDPKQNRQLQNQKGDVIVRRTWLSRPASVVDTQKQTQTDEGTTFASYDYPVATDPTVFVDPTDPNLEPTDPTVINSDPNQQNGAPSATNITISIITLSKDIQVQLQILDGSVATTI